MPGTQERRYSRLEDMSDDQLRQILREDASKSESEDTDMELTLRVMEVLAARRKERNEGRSPAEAMDSFNENYCTNKQFNLISEKVREPKIKHSNGLWKRFAAVAAVLVLVITFSTVTASAWDFDLWEIISKWTQETFHFGQWGEETPVPAEDQPCSSLQAALDDYKVTEKLIPTWLPEGYEEVYVDIQENPMQRNYFATYQCEDKEISIRIADFLNEDPHQVEQSDELIEIYVSKNMEYYIFDNYDRVRAVWVNGSFECQITGVLTIDEIKMMIDSIGRTE